MYDGLTGIYLSDIHIRTSKIEKKSDIGKFSYPDEFQEIKLIQIFFGFLLNNLVTGRMKRNKR